MCRSMVDIQSATTEIRRGKEKKERKNKQEKNTMSASAMQGGHTEATCASKTPYWPADCALM